MGRVLLVDVLAVLFGLGTWICVNGLWVELPLFVQVLPEAWNLPSYLSVVTQLANVAPLSYSILNSFFPNVVSEKRTIYLTIVVGSLSTFLVSLFWKSTSYWLGESRSTGLLTLVFFMAMVDCSSRVLYLPFMSKFKEIYLTSFFIGEGLTAFVPSIFALIQGVGGNPECRLVNETDANGTSILKYDPYTSPPRFTVEVFFYFLFSIVIISAIAFHLLTYNSVVKKALASRPSPRHSAYVKHSNVDQLDGPESIEKPFYEFIPGNTIEFMSSGIETEMTNKDEIGVSEFTKESGVENNNVALGSGWDLKKSDHSTSSHDNRILPKSIFIYVLVIQVFACMLSNGVFPSIQSYSCMPYGNLAYHLVATLSPMANPAVCFLLFVIPKPTKQSITIVFSLAVLVSAYVMTTAVQSPEPPFVGKIHGEAFLVISWILLVALFTYVKVSVATILRTDGKRGLFWCGAITQVGSAIGALVTFFVVNYTSTFHSYIACQSENDMLSSTPLPALI